MYCDSSPFITWMCANLGVCACTAGTSSCRGQVPTHQSPPLSVNPNIHTPSLIHPILLPRLVFYFLALRLFSPGVQTAFPIAWESPCVRSSFLSTVSFPNAPGMEWGIGHCGNHPLQLFPLLPHNHPSILPCSLNNFLLCLNTHIC